MLTSLQEGFRASLSQLQGRGVEIAMRDSYGLKSLESCAKFDRDSHSLRTYQACLRLTEDEPLTECLATFHRSGMICFGIVYQLQPLVQIIRETDCGLLQYPTPRVCSGERSSGMNRSEFYRMWPTPDASQRGTRSEELIVNESTVKRRGSGQKRGIDLQTAVKFWPTPTVQDSENDAGPSQFQRNSLPLNTMVHAVDGPQKKNGSLNPGWVEWLMMYPIGWTDLDASAMQSFRKSRKSFSKKSGE